MFDDSDDRTASLMTPARLAQLKVRTKPAASPAAWLDQMAADAGSVHVRRLLDLRHQLAALLHAGEVRAIVGGCESLHEVLAQVDFSLVQPRGWLARMTGGGKEADARFAGQHARALQAGATLAREVQTLQHELHAQCTAVERTLLDLDGELRAIEKILDQGARWLQDMRNQLKARRPAEGEAVPAQGADDAARCELLVARLKLLRAAASATQHVLQHGRTACDARAALAAHCAQVLGAQWLAWRGPAGSVAEEVAAHEPTGDAVELARKALPPLQAALHAAGEEARAVQAQDQALTDEVVALQGLLQVAA